MRSERSGKGNGRVYQINFTAEDGQGGSCTGIVQVGVPHDKGKEAVLIDDGQLYDSTLQACDQHPHSRANKSIGKHAWKGESEHEKHFHKGINHRDIEKMENWCTD